KRGRARINNTGEIMRGIIFITALLARTSVHEHNEEAVPATHNIQWDKIGAGITIDEIRAHYPRQGKKVKWHGTKQTEVEDVVILPGCEAEVEIQHASGTVDAVKVKGKGSIGGRCSDKVLGALAAKYGQPGVQRKMQESL